MRLRISLQETGTKFSLGFDEKRCFTLGFHESFAKSANAQYAGSYEVIPKISEQYLSTQDRWLSRDLVRCLKLLHRVQAFPQMSLALK